MKRYLCLFTVFIIVIILGLYKLGISFYEYDRNNNSKVEATVCDIGKETEYFKSYIIEIKNNKFILYVKKANKSLCIGNKIQFEGEFITPAVQRNEGGYDYSLYLKTKKILGSFKPKTVEIIGKETSIWYKWKQLIREVRNSIKNYMEKNLKQKNAGLLMGLLIGDTEEITDETANNFRKASLTHILAISGSNFAYIIIILNQVNKIGKRKRLGQIITIICILFFMELTGNTASVIRAGVMAILMIVASITRMKYDIWTSMAFSLLVQIIYNPYCIFDLGLILSYGGVAGLLLFYKRLEKIVKYKLVRAIISANILIIPIMMYNFNTFSLSFILSNVITSFLIEFITIIGIISIFFRFKIVYIILNISLSLLNWIVEVCAKIPLSEIYIKTPSIVSIILYYCIIIIVLKRTKIKNFKKIMASLITIICLSNLNFTVIKLVINNQMMIHFIDVGQGDAMLIRKGNKNILIDGGGGTDDKYDMGKRVLVPYLLYKKINKIDIIIVSHFDSDHVRRTTYTN